MSPLAFFLAAALAAAPVAVDGDTFKFDGATFRLLNVDTPELSHPRCAAEYDLAVRARDRLTDLLGKGDIVFEARYLDRYGRTVARVTAGGVDVGEVLVREGLALKWRPGPVEKAKRLAVWCPK